ncbi:MAG: DNA polymerase III subunit gamma/tau [Chloroflexi bacterium]|nr:DNA polymerase III subunit gamma/tau [Chloroflexota bacterium]
MSTVFYRKWRPTRFSDVVGQEHITDTLRRAVLSDRVAHAYLFTGPRGVGKTSTARILAKALNAELDEHGDPIPETENAIAIDEGRFMDLIEIDAASNRGVGDIRDLRERVLLRPTVGQFKVYIIDEVHMLTTEAFNALLKTLEEPPPQVVMILATTDIHRVPATIISRCQRFDFRRLTTDDVIGRLILICEEEEIECEPAVLELVARSAWGSLRDAENLLEQLAVSYGTGEITEAQARELLGIGDTSSARNLASAILRKDAKRALEIIEEEASRGAELKGLRDSTISALRGALLAKHGIASIYGELGDTPDLEPEAMGASTDQMLHAITIFGRNERFGEASSPLALEIAALQAVAEPPKPESPAVAPQPARQPTRRSAPTVQQAPQAEPAPSQPAPADTSGSSRILEEIGKAAGTQVRTTFAQVNFIGPNNGVLVLQPKYTNGAKRLRDAWMNEEIRAKLRPAFQSVYGNDIRIQLQQAPSPAPATTRASTPAETRPAPEPTQFSTPPSNQLSDQSQPFDADHAITNHPAVQNLRSLGGRVVAIEDD